MNLTIPEELALFSQELQHCLSPDVLQTLAREVGFVFIKKTSTQKPLRMAS